ncbi:hypothetical protein BGW80DRAFT_583394 [Lactifluus volemus]|nr:hypothetical protein BGW80DRAFT_583394 [Lactifluus volemus]
MGGSSRCSALTHDRNLCNYIYALYACGCGRSLRPWSLTPHPHPHLSLSSRGRHGEAWINFKLLVRHLYQQDFEIVVTIVLEGLFSYMSIGGALGHLWVLHCQALSDADIRTQQQWDGLRLDAVTVVNAISRAAVQPLGVPTEEPCVWCKTWWYGGLDCEYAFKSESSTCPVTLAFT